MSIASILFAILGLSFLIFIHELGHYYMAKKSGMNIEVFSIGMGKPIFSWMRDGVKWQVCYMLFGGYVKIAGMEGENGKEPYQVMGGFYSKKPIYRLLVAGAGPFVNIVFALLVFAGIYYVGGQEKPFSQFTSVVGSVDPTSHIYEEGIRPGDKILAVNNTPYGGFRDVVMQGMLKNTSSVSIVFDKGNGDLFEEAIKLYSPDRGLVANSFPKEWKTMGVLSPASYVVAGKFSEKEKEYAPLAASGILENDRVVYVDGTIIYSVAQLSEVVNKDIALVTVDRDGEKIHLQIPRVVLGDLKLSEEQRDEFVDYKRDMDLEGAIASTYFIPYLVSEGLYVQDGLSFIEDDREVVETKLLSGDKILAVAGMPVATAADFYEAIAERRCLVMVNNKAMENPLWKDADGVFLSGLDKKQIAEMEAKIGDSIEGNVGTYRFLKPSQPVSYKSYLEKTNIEALEKNKKALPPEEYSEIISKQTLFSGMNIKDEKVVYNPGPFTLAKDVLNDIVFSLKALFSGKVSPKHMSGPVGMVKIVHDGSKSSLTTGFYWLGMISLNLGFMNLLPIPVLDGGHICFTLYEVVTKKKIKAKTMQRMVMPFVALIIFFFAYVTFHDLIKVFS